MRIPERSRILKDWLNDHTAVMSPTRAANLAVTTFLIYSPINFKLALIYDYLRSGTIKLHQGGASM